MFALQIGRVTNHLFSEMEHLTSSFFELGVEYNYNNTMTMFEGTAAIHSAYT